MTAASTTCPMMRCVCALRPAHELAGLHGLCAHICPQAAHALACPSRCRVQQASIASGFDNTNAYYIGNQALNALQLARVQICVGTISGCNVDCHDIKPEHIGAQISDGWSNVPSSADVPEDFKKMIACFTGQVRTMRQLTRAQRMAAAPSNARQL